MFLTIPTLHQEFLTCYLFSPDLNLHHYNTEPCELSLKRLDEIKLNSKLTIKFKQLSNAMLQSNQFILWSDGVGFQMHALKTY